MKNPPFDSLVWGSLRLTQTDVDVKYLLMVFHWKMNLHTPSMLTELYLVKFCVVFLFVCIYTYTSGVSEM